MMRSAFLRRVRNARQQRFLYVSNISLFWKHKQQIWLEFAATFSLPLHPWRIQSLASEQMEPTLSWIPRWKNTCFPPLMYDWISIVFTSIYHKVFDVAEEVSKVNVEQVARCGDHDVVIVPVSYPLCAWRHMIITWLSCDMHKPHSPRRKLRPSTLRKSG